MTYPLLVPAQDYFVYALETEWRSPFYVGYSSSDCVANRHLNHVRQARTDLAEGRQVEKNKIIVRMLDAGLRPEFRKVLENLTLPEALACECETITKLGRLDLGTGFLTNTKPGGLQNAGACTQRCWIDVLMTRALREGRRHDHTELVRLAYRLGRW